MAGVVADPTLGQVGTLFVLTISQPVTGGQ